MLNGKECVKVGCVCRMARQHRPPSHCKAKISLVDCLSSVGSVMQDWRGGLGVGPL